MADVLTMRERWEQLLGTKTGCLTASHIQPLFPISQRGATILINAAVFATPEITKQVTALQPGQKLLAGEILIAAHTDTPSFIFGKTGDEVAGFSGVTFEGEVKILSNVWDLFSLNDYALRLDFQQLTAGRQSQPIPEDVSFRGNVDQIFLEAGAIIQPGCIINAATGPVYIGKDAEVMEGSLLRGPVALGDHAVLKMGAKVYGATTIGPGCKVGGEVNNVVFFANSNKGHDGFLGNAVIGEWCNLGADTNCSNLKNNYDEVKIWSEDKNRAVKTGLQFCGLLMGDHSKCGINTMFNTGTVVGVSANIFGSNFPEKYIPSFSWGGSEGMQTYDFTKAMATADRMMGRRNLKMTEAETTMYRHLFDQSASLREFHFKLSN
ncbi:MAG: glucose-1-phosphate thymidylyltransferase [Sphingobacteriales bacterium]|nr:MAG: glucose-1-phosphate thymidylyltransferase [Sphingobacteriales bacterium]